MRYKSTPTPPTSSANNRILINIVSPYITSKRAIYVHTTFFSIKSSYFSLSPPIFFKASVINDKKRGIFHPLLGKFRFHSLLGFRNTHFLRVSNTDNYIEAIRSHKTHIL